MQDRRPSPSAPTTTAADARPGHDDLAWFRRLAEAPEFAQFALILHQLTGLLMALNTPDVGFILPGRPLGAGNPLCLLIRRTPEGGRRCLACDRTHHARALATGRPTLYTCHAGFLDIAVPVLVQGVHVATISSGQVLPERPSDAAFERLARRWPWLDIPRPRLRRAYDRALWLPRPHLVQVMRLLELFGRQMFESAWRIRQLEARLDRAEIRNAKELVAERFREPGFCLADAAGRAGLSRAYFSHLFHRETGQTFTAFVQARRVEEAKRLLLAGKDSITAIAFACGFGNLTHFNRVFRGQEGCSPRQFRRREAPAIIP